MIPLVVLRLSLLVAAVFPAAAAYRGALDLYSGDARRYGMLLEAWLLVVFGLVGVALLFGVAMTLP